MKRLKYAVIPLLGLTMVITASCTKPDDPNNNGNNGGGNNGGGINGSGLYNGNYEYVDLGLPSGTMWATFNVGAASPEDYGVYFAWGEIEPKSTYNFSTYKYCSNGDSQQLTKYCPFSWYGYGHDEYGYNGFTDTLTILEPNDDAATVKWGNDWCMPTWAEWTELRENTTATWTTQNGINGCLFTSNNGNSIFLPCAGYCHDNILKNNNEVGYYWSRSLDLSWEAPDFAIGIYFGHPQASNPNFCSSISSGRHKGFSIRPVKNVFGPDVNHEYVDLGLPSGNLWATCNIGAKKPENHGTLFAWGETSPRTDDYQIEPNKYKYYDDGYTKYCQIPDYGSNGYADRFIMLQPEDDAASVNWGDEWFTPTPEDWDELLCLPHEKINGGMLFTGSNGQTLFLNGQYYYMTNQLYPINPSKFFALGLFSYIKQIDRFRGSVVRPVRKPNSTPNINSGGLGIIDNHEYVDLGLPSGNLWATCNIGASIPEEYGDYFAWAETDPKSSYSWDNYKWGKEETIYEGGHSYSYWTFTKYTCDDSDGPEAIGLLEPMDDAAVSNWGEGWHIPSSGDWQELLDNCFYGVATLNTVGGCYFIGRNGQTLFLPNAGSYSGSTLYNDGSYWTNKYLKAMCSSALCFMTGIHEQQIELSDRYNGNTIRPVFSGNDNGGGNNGGGNGGETPSSYTITVSAHPNNGGTVSGGGTFQQGQTCTVSAIANNGYKFTNWTENNNVVSTNAQYSFVVTANRELTANFKSNTLFAIDFEWYKYGPSASGLEEYGLCWHYNQKDVRAHIEPLEGVTLYSFDSPTWDATTNDDEKENLFANNGQVIDVYNNVSVMYYNSSYDDVIGTRMPDGTLHLIHVTSCTVGESNPPYGFSYHIYGQSK